eukprot:gene20534-26634_t
MNNSNRRMVGHGSLAMKALLPLIPSFLEFPYCIRVTSECTASNGSSSMATVCGASLALMDCGVPIKSPAAGLSIGLVTKTGDNGIDKYVLLSDILGMEDHYGDMDFKIAGTENGITAVQLDVKIPGLPINVLNEALDRAKEKRLVILSEMNKVIPQANKNTKTNTPKAEIIKFDIERAKFLIGPYGEMSDYIQRTFNAIFVDKLSGFIKVSRKETLDPILSVPDNIEPYILDSAEVSAATFSVTPPVKYSKTFFRSNVVSKQVLEKVSSKSNETIEMTADEVKIDDNFYDRAINVNVNTTSNNKIENNSNIINSQIINNPKVENNKIEQDEKAVKDIEYQTTTAFSKVKISNKISNKNSQLYDFISTKYSKDSTTIDLPTELQEAYSDNQTLNKKNVLVMNSDSLELDNLYEFNNISTGSISSNQAVPFAKDEIKSSDNNVAVNELETVTPKRNAEILDANYNNQIEEKSVSIPIQTIDTTINQSTKSTDSIEVTTPPKRKRGRPKKIIESTEKFVDTPSTVIVESTTRSNKIETAKSNEKISKPKKSKKNENIFVNNDVKSNDSPIQISNEIIQSIEKETNNIIFDDSKIKQLADKIQLQEKVAGNVISDNTITQESKNNEQSHEVIIEINKPIELLHKPLEINHSINETNRQVKKTSDNIVNTTDSKDDDNDNNAYYKSLKIIIKPKK